jgi:peroxiredoxin
MVMKNCLFVILLLSFANLFSQQINLDHPLSLPGISGKKLSLHQFKENKASVVIFFSPECPICVSMTKTIREMADTFAQQGVKFYIIYPGNYYSNKHIREFQKSYLLKMGGYRDDNNALVKALGAKVTPQAIVISPAGKIVYSGKIDNWFEDIGKRRTIITQFYLHDALTAIIKNQAPPVEKTDPVGCFIMVN